MAVQGIILALLGSTFGLIALLVGIIAGILLFFYRKGVKGETLTKHDTTEDEEDIS